MPAPNVNINLFDLTVYAPSIANAIIGCVGPATKGPINTLTDITDTGNFVNTFGRPVDRQYAPRGSIRYLTAGSKLKFNRIAGRNLAPGVLQLFAADGKTLILTLTAASSGTWANDDLSVSVVYNGNFAYNIYVYFLGQLAEQYLNVNNGNIISKINNGSTRMTAVLAPGAGATFPAQTLNAVTGAVAKLPFAGGNDGAFASTDSLVSSTSGVAGKRFHGKMDTTAGSRVFENILTITPSLAGLTTIRGTVNMAVVPGTFTIRVQTGAGPTYLELADNGNLSYTPGGAGVGILAPAASTHTGYIDYRTGAWGVKLASGTTFNTGTVDGIWTRANTESVGATAKGVGAYAGNLSSSPLGVGFFNSNRVVITVPIDELVGAPIGGAGSLSSEAALKTLAGWTVPGSIVLTPAHATAPVPPPIFDDGFGGWRTGPNGTGVPVAGTINYRTGVWVVTTWPTIAMPASGTLGATYALQILDMGGGAVASTSGTFKTLLLTANSPGGATVASGDAGSVPFELPVLPGNVKVVLSLVSGNPLTIFDDGLGGWLTRPRGDPRAAAVTGSINYATGAWTITPSVAVDATSTITGLYTKVASSRARRALRGTGPEFVANTTANAAGLDLSDPAIGNNFDGLNFLDHGTGQFAFTLDLVPTGPNTFDLEDGGTLTAVYVPASILGFGDGTKVTFVGALGDAPYRRQANRLVGFQGAEFSIAGSGDPQVTFATLGTAFDFWTENVALSTDPLNRLDFRGGSASIKWTSAPLLDESTFVVAEEVVVHFDSRYPGDIGNERPTLTDGLYVIVDADPALAGTLRAQVMFGTSQVESFGLATTLAELVTEINDPINGSDYITATEQAAGSFIPVDVGAAQNCGMSGAFTVADVVGVKVGQTYTGLQQFQNDEVIPVDWLIVPGQWHRQVITALQQLCERPRRRALGVIPMPDETDPYQHRNFVDGNYGVAPGSVAVATARVPFPPLVAVDSSQLTLGVPWVNYFDGYTNAEVWEPLDGDMMALVAATPQPWFPIAGNRRGVVLADQIRYSAASDDRDLLYGEVGDVTEILNFVVAKTGRGLILMGQRTAQRNPTSLDRINVRWTMNTLMKLIDLASQDFLFELNDSVLWREASATLNAIIKPMIDGRGLTDAFIVIDGTTNTPDVIDSLTMAGKLFVKPARAVEYISFDLILTPTGADFSSLVTG